MSRKNNKYLYIGLSILLLISILLFFNLKQTVFFTEGYLPYGESTNQITGLINQNTLSDVNHNLKSTYWDIVARRNLIKGNDFNLITESSAFNSAVSFTTTNNFNDKIFQSEIELNIGHCTRNPCYYPNFNPTTLSISIKTPTKGYNLYSESINSDSASIKGIITVKPSVIDDTVYVFWNGKQIKELNISESYKIVISSEMFTSAQSGSTAYRSTASLKIINPSYKSEFGCTKKPNEQNYLAILNEGNNININDLKDFTKFCLDESPLEIINNAGSTTDTNALIKIVNGETLTVPVGQIWGIRYIGEKGLFTTSCEVDQTLLLNDNQCTSTSALTIAFPKNTEINLTNDSSITVMTEPNSYQKTTISTHQKLENTGKLIFTHIVQNDNLISAKTFDLLGYQFKSNGVKYIGTNNGFIVYPEDKNNWKVNFNYKTSYIGSKDDKFNLNNYTLMEITNIESVKSRNKGVEDYKIDYTFTIDVSFLDIKYENKKIILINNYPKSLNGGVIITTNDNLGKTEIKNIQRTLKTGENIFDIDTTNLLDMKIRPYITINSNGYNYSFDSDKALIIDNLDKSKPKIFIEKNISYKLIIISIIIGLLILLVIFFIIKKVIKRK